MPSLSCQVTVTSSGKWCLFLCSLILTANWTRWRQWSRDYLTLAGREVIIFSNDVNAVSKSPKRVQVAKKCSVLALGARIGLDDREIWVHLLSIKPHHLEAESKQGMAPVRTDSVCRCVLYSSKRPSNYRIVSFFSFEHSHHLRKRERF